MIYFFFLKAEDGIRNYKVTGVQTCALPIFGEGLEDEPVDAAPSRHEACHLALEVGERLLARQRAERLDPHAERPDRAHHAGLPAARRPGQLGRRLDRKSTRLNSSHLVISYAVFCLKKKKKHLNSTYLLKSEA